jgi:UDP:flavonoid glycosyltransferase YjiC (YdhE family)
MRVLLTTIPERGHFTPLIPLGQALVGAGHAVAVATAESFGAVVERADFEHVPAGIDSREARRRLLQRHPEFAELPADQAWRVVTDLFIGQFGVALLEDSDRVLAWRPDVVVREEGEFAGPILAARAGVPWVDQGWGPLRPTELVTRAAEALAPMWVSLGLDPDPTGGAYRWLYLDPCPPSLQFPHANDVAVLHRIRPVPPLPVNTDGAPSWLEQLGDRRAVYVTLGTVPVFADDVAFFQASIEALRDQDVEIIVTVGPAGNPVALGPQPPTVHVERFIPQALVLPHCAAVVTNGGSGSTLGALAAGVPVIAVGDFRSPSQVRNGQAVADRGAGRALARADVTPQRLRDEIRAVLDEPSYRRVAQQIATEIAEMPTPNDAADLVARLVEHGQPLLRSQST